MLESGLRPDGLEVWVACIASGTYMNLIQKGHLWSSHVDGPVKSDITVMLVPDGAVFCHFAMDQEVIVGEVVEVKPSMKRHMTYSATGWSAPLDLSKSGESKVAPDISGLFSRVKTRSANAWKCSKQLMAHKCCVCQYKCKSAQILYNHMKKVHSDKKLYPCHSCSKSFNTDHDHQVHVNTVHHKHLHCKLCKYVMYNNFRMTNHQHTHDLPKIECPHCDVKLCSNKALYDHIRRHADTTIYACSQCGKEFSSDASQHIHLWGKHSQGYVCPRCNECFDSLTQRACHHKVCT